MKRRDKYDQLIRDGFCIFNDILSSDFIRRLDVVTARLATEQNREHPGAYLTQGSMVRIPTDPIFADLITWPPSLEALRSMGFEYPTFTDGYVISKPPQSPSLFWHYDWFAWDDPEAHAPRPQQVFLMYYLSDTSAVNGCLRVIPGSHLTHNTLHDLLMEPHSKNLSDPEDFKIPAFSQRPDEIDVPVTAGDLVMGDARMLHAAHANQTEERRTVITLWYQPDFESLPDRVKAQMVAKTQDLPGWWPVEAREAVEALHPRYNGAAVPYGRTLYRRNPTE